MTAATATATNTGTRNRALAALAVALVAAAIVRIATAGYSLWFDELASLFFAGQPLDRLWSGWMVRETNPPLFYTILHGWIALAGLGETALRLPPIAASLLAIVVLFTGVRRSYGYAAAACAALLLATSTQQLYFSHQIRAYIFLYLAVATSFCGLMRVAAAEGDDLRATVAGWAAYAGGALAGVYLHTTGVVWPAAASLALMLVDRRFRPFRGTLWLHLAAADAIVLAGSAWWLWITWLQLRVPNANIGWMEDMRIAKTAAIYVATALQSRQIAPWQAAAPLLFGALALAGAVRTWRRIETRLTVACFAAATLVFLVLNLKQAVMLDRTLFWLSIFPLVMAAVGLAGLRGRLFPTAVAALTVLQAVNLAVLAPRLIREDWRAPVARLAGDPRAVLLVDGEAMNVATDRACAVELSIRRCPFPVLAVVDDAPQIDTWATDQARPVPSSRDGRLVLPDDAAIYLFRRPYHDVLAELHGAGFARDVPATALPSPELIGPLPSSFVLALKAGAHVDHGIVRVAGTASGHGPAIMGPPGR